MFIIIQSSPSHSPSLFPLTCSCLSLSSWCLSLAHVISSFSLNSSICTEAGGKYALDQKPLAQLRCKALLVSIVNARYIPVHISVCYLLYITVIICHL